MFLRLLLVAAGCLLTLTWPQIKFYSGAQSLPCCWRSGPRPPPAGGPGRPAAGDVPGSRRLRAWSWSRWAAACPRMPRGLGLAADRWGEGHKPVAGWGQCSQGPPPAWAPPKEGEKVKVSRMSGGAIVRTRRQNTLPSVMSLFQLVCRLQSRKVFSDKHKSWQQEVRKGLTHVPTI